MAFIADALQFLIPRVLVLFYGGLATAGMLIRMVTSPKKLFRRVERKVPPQCLLDEKLGTHKFADLKEQGVKLHYVEIGDPTKPLMLFVHGFPEFWYSWRFQMEEFKKDYRVVAFDTRGYNESSKPTNVSDYEVPVLCDDIKALVGFLGYESCVLVGHDWGGAIVWATAQKYPDIVNTLVVMNAPHGGAAKKYIAKNPSQLRKSWYMFVFQLPVIPELFMKSNDFKFAEIALADTSRGGAKCISRDDLEAYKYVFGKPEGTTSAINYYRANVLTARGETVMNRTEQNRTEQTCHVSLSGDLGNQRPLPGAGLG